VVSKISPEDFDTTFMPMLTKYATDWGEVAKDFNLKGQASPRQFAAIYRAMAARYTFSKPEDDLHKLRSVGFDINKFKIKDI
jgi:hypothetical protein